ncbi:MAG TPA: hypothetical protein VL486_16290 [Verrucomicrobiae bacterium]|nr:hypothetical protein [Verrucomicrobiae bacterium]
MKVIMLLLSVTLLGAFQTARAAEPVAREPAATNESPVAKPPPVTRELALAAVAMLETNAASNAGVEAANEIIRFARESKAVTITLNPYTVPWAPSKALENEVAVRLLLLAAYIGGDAKAQLLAQTTADDPYAGWQLLIDVYRQIRQKKPAVTIPEIDALAEKQKKGELKQYADEIKNKKPTPQHPLPSSGNAARP